MSDEIVEYSTIREYLLGDLPESEAERIESWYFANGQAVDEVWAAFGEIAEESLSGALSENEARRFEQRLQSSPALREMFENEKAIRDYANRIATTDSRQIKSDDSVLGGWRRWRLPAMFFKSHRLVAGGVVALVALGALGAIDAWFTLRAPQSLSNEGSQQAKAQDQKDPNSVSQPSIDPKLPLQPGAAANEMPVEGKKTVISQPNRGKSAPGVGTETTATFLLLAGGTREGESYTTLEIPGRTETIQLELEPPTDDCAVFSAVLQTESGEELQRWERLQARRGDYSPLKIARLRIHAGSLKDAGYVVRLECASRVNNRAPAAEYRFKIKKNIS
ncbi:MAG TPA: hypothetical protein VFV58_01875 [Blastocatellia bacterium]|nr:hypothetical protein [Blastocatellia bacterium]